MSAEVCEKLERARELMRHRNPGGDLAVVVERAIDVLLEKLEEARLGKASRPSHRVRSPKAGRVSRATRREVFARDGERCACVSDAGARCESRGFLEIDHVDPRALGGTGDPSNLRVLCRSHNQLRAEQVFGRTTVASAMEFRRRKSGQSGHDADLCRPMFDAAMCGLKNLGFRETEARRALAAVAARHREEQAPPPLEEVIREALAVLT